MLVDIYTQDESLVRAIAEHLEPAEQLRRSEVPDASRLPMPQTLFVLDSRSVNPELLAVLLARASDHDAFSLVIVATAHAIHDVTGLAVDTKTTDFLVWPSPSRVLATRLTLLRNHFARRSLPHHAGLTLDHPGGDVWSATESLPVMISVADPSGTLSISNAAMRRFLGDAPLRFQEGHSWVNWIHPDDRTQALNQYAKAIATKSLVHVGMRLRRQDGEWRHVHSVQAPVFDEDGSFAGFVTSFEDVTEQLAVLDKLRDSEAMYRELAESTPLKIAVIAPDGTFSFRNSAFRTSIPAGTTMDKLTWTIFHPDDLATAERYYAEWLKGREHGFEVRLRVPGTETYLWHRVFNTPVRNAQGVIERWILSSMNIDEEKRRTEEIKQLYAKLSDESRAKRDFLATLAHELRTPLNVILGYCSLLEESVAVDSDEQRVLSRMDHDARLILAEVEKLPWPGDGISLHATDFKQDAHVD